MGDSSKEDPKEDSDNSGTKRSKNDIDLEDDGGGKNPARASKASNVPLGKLFSMSDRWDVLLMLFGTLGACIRGSVSPVFFAVTGKIFESFGQSTSSLQSEITGGNFPDELLKVITQLRNLPSYSLPHMHRDMVAGCIPTLLKTLTTYALMGWLSWMDAWFWLQIAIMYSGLSVIFFVGGFVELSCWLYTGERQATRLRRKYLEAILTQEVGYFETHGNTAEIANSLTESIAEIQTGIGEKMGHGVGYMWAALSTQVVGFYFCWQIALLTLVIIPVVTSAGKLFQSTLFTVSNKIRAESSKADFVVEETISQIRTVYSYVGETRALTSFAEALQNCVNLGRKAGLTKGIGLGSMVGTVNMSWALVFYVAGVLISGGHVRPGNAIVSIMCVVLGGLTFSYIVPDIQAFEKARRLAYPLHRVLERQPAVRSSNVAKPLDPDGVEGKFELQGVYFVYPSRPEATVFSNFSARIPAGQSLAIVGESGSGKSTIISLLARFYDPIRGKVLLDGEDIKTLNLHNLRRFIGLVGQEPALFATDIMENIRLGRPGATTKECIEAAKAANAHSFICLLPDGYNTHVGDRGTQLSGGQKQRIAIARAVLKNPVILLLDEATSALDAESERVVQVALNSLILGRTCVVVAHRLSTISNVDAIAVLSAGKIVEQGSPSELLAKGENGKFYQLKHTQDLKQYTLCRTKNNTQMMTSPSSSSILDSSQSEYSSARVRNSWAMGTSSPCFTLEAGSSAEFVDFDVFSTEKNAIGTPGRHSMDFPTIASKDNKKGKDHITPTTTLSALAALKLILGLTKPKWKRVVLGWFGSISNGAVKPALAFLVVKASLNLFTENPMETILKNLHTYCVAFAVVALYATLTSSIEHSQLVLVGQVVAKTIRERLFAATLRNEVGWYDRQENKSAMVTGRLAADGASINMAVSSLASSFINNISAVLFAICLGLYLEWRMTLINTTLIPLYLFSGFFRYRVSLGFADVTRESNEEVTHIATESVSNIRTVYSFTMETQVLDRLIVLSDGLLRKAVKRAILAGLANGAVTFLPILGYCICIYYIQSGMRNHTIAFAAAFTVYQVISNTSINLSELVTLLPSLPKVVKSANSINDILNRKSEMDPDVSDSTELENLEGFIELREVQFRYPSRPEVRVLNNINLRIEAGQTVALVGESGSGKSSIIALIERFYEPTGGRILIDNVDIQNLNLKLLRQKIGFVQQEPTLFNLTIKQNILYGREEATEAEMIEAAKAASAHNFIAGLPEGYNTLVGDRGSQLSGGQKQRVAIARAILKNPLILLLDEATSALDTESEKIVQQALDKLLVIGSRTTLVVAHRLSTIQDANMIVGMSEGQIVEQGNHNTLILKGGLYARLLATHRKQN